MQIKHYAKVVARTDQFKALTREKRREIAIFGLVSEIGSLVSAIKKEQLKEGGILNSKIARAEVKEELGDVIWYAFALAQIEDEGNAPDILEMDIANLKAELEGKESRTKRIHSVLPEEDLKKFLEGAAVFSNIANREFRHYQELAFLTARTRGETLHTVCLAVLTQLGAQLMRLLLPKIEKELNTQLVDREVFVILGEIAWHLSALAKLHKIDLDDVAKLNAKKAQFRTPDGKPTPFHDDPFEAHEQFPRQFEIEFQSLGPRKSRMLWNGEPLGNDLTDNADVPDGYRFHDVLHLSNIANLGWSPVLRGFMKLKREDKTVDEVQDGGRAKILEEMIILFIHLEGARRASLAQPDISAEQRRLYPEDEDIPFGFLKKVHGFSVGYEPAKNKYWEWKKVIQDGYRLYFQLCQAGQGIVKVDMDKRSVEFVPTH